METTTAQNHEFDQMKKDFVMDVLSNTETNASDSKELYVRGISTQLATSVEKFYTNPLESMFDSLNSLHGNASKMIKDVFNKFLNRNKELISRAYLHDSEESIVYYISLKEDTIDNRERLFEFLDNYESIASYSKFVNVKFIFIPKKTSSDFTRATELTFA